MSEIKTRYQSFTLLISSIYRNIYKIKDREMAAFGLKGTHVTCLFYLYQCGGRTAAEICKESGEDKAAISRAVEFLKQGGYICANEANYRKPLMLTRKGKETASYIVGKIDDYFEKTRSELTSEEVATLYKALDVIDKNLKCGGSND